jgi:hypothetical protein
MGKSSLTDQEILMMNMNETASSKASLQVSRFGSPSFFYHSIERRNIDEE